MLRCCRGGLLSMLLMPEGPVGGAMKASRTVWPNVGV